MVSIDFIRKNPELVQKGADNKLIKCDVARLLEVDNQMRKDLAEIEKLNTQRNAISKSKDISNEEKANQVKAIKEELKVLEERYNNAKIEFDALIAVVPSVPLDEVPIGKDENDNVEIRKVGEIPNFNFEPKDHLTLMQNLNMVETTKAVKFAGSRGYALKNDAVKLEMALMQYAIDKLASKGYEPHSVPVMVKGEAMYGTGYFPVGQEQAYNITEDGLYLVGTSEVSLVSLHSNEILNAEELPIKMAGISTCFRREIGSAGRDVYGLYRVHQFQKVEQVVICKADDEEMTRLHEEILKNSEEILQDLKIPYHVVLCCTGELGIGQVKKYDVEAWMPSRNAYCETHSASEFRDFQARRSNIKYRDENGKLQFCYTLNNTALASPRFMIPLLELYQQEDGSILIPEVLRPYMQGRKYIGKNED
ncbi:MAG: serine--tRNA ligase [Clostridia bacterium]|nr:serine--tRNA ligase [Clostridia bacterium]